MQRTQNVICTPPMCFLVCDLFYDFFGDSWKQRLKQVRVSIHKIRSPIIRVWKDKSCSRLAWICWISWEICLLLLFYIFVLFIYYDYFCFVIPSALFMQFSQSIYAYPYYFLFLHLYLFLVGLDVFLLFLAPWYFGKCCFRFSCRVIYL